MYEMTKWRQSEKCAGASAHELSAESAALLGFTELYSDHSWLCIDWTDKFSEEQQ